MYLDKSETDREMDKEVAENHRRALERKELYRQFGYDMDAERAFILDSAGPLGKRILEIGTGKGYTTVALARRGYIFTTCDISAEEQQYARLNLRYYGLEKQVRFILGHDGRLPFDPTCFDTVLSVNTLHHLECPGQMIDEMARILAPGGKLVLSDFTTEGFELVERVHRLEGRIHSVGNLMVVEAARMLARSGFEIKVSSSRYQEILLAFRAESPGLSL